MKKIIFSCFILFGAFFVFESFYLYAAPEQVIAVKTTEDAIPHSFWISKLIKTLTILLIGIILFRLLHFSLKKFETFITQKEAIRENEMTLRLKTLSALIKWLGSITLIGFMVYMILENFGINMAPFLAGAGIVGLAFGFGGQYLIRDIINGIFILLENQYGINDVVEVAGRSGLVEGVNLRYTQLRDLEGRVIYIPNGEIKTVVNFTKDYAYALLSVGVAYKENTDRVIAMIKDIGAKMRKDAFFGRLIIGDLEMFGVDALAESQVTIQFRIKTLPIKQWDVAREFRRRLKKEFDEKGIEIPFPHHTLYWGTGKQNEWMKEMLARVSYGEAGSEQSDARENVV